jgi:hypothetical protein
MKVNLSRSLGDREVCQAIDKMRRSCRGAEEVDGDDRCTLMRVTMAHSSRAN